MIPLTKLFHEPWSHLAAPTVVLSFNKDLLLNEPLVTFRYQTYLSNCRALPDVVHSKTFVPFFAKWPKKLLFLPFGEKKLSVNKTKRKNGSFFWGKIELTSSSVFFRWLKCLCNDWNLFPQAFAVNHYLSSDLNLLFFRTTWKTDAHKGLGCFVTIKWALKQTAFFNLCSIPRSLI